MNRVLVLSFLMMACSSDGSDKPTTSLEGSITCEAMTCVSGQLCKSQAQGIDSGAPNPRVCATVPSDCRVFDCTGLECPTCILEMCRDRNLDAYVRLSGRELGCPAQ